MAVQEAEMGVAGGVPREQRPMPFAGGAGRTAGPVTIYVANKAGNTVTPIRAASNRAGRPIRVGPGPELIAISPDGQTAYVVGVGSLLPEQAAAPVTLTAIRTATNRPGRVITVCASGNPGGVDAPYAIAITPDSRTVYVSCAGTVVPVRAGADTASEPIRVSSAGTLAMAAEGRTVYVANPGGDTITPISTATEEPGPPIVVGPSPDAMAVTPDGRTVLVLTSAGVTGVTAVDAVTNRAGKPVAIQGACALRVAPGGGTAYVLATPDPNSQQGFVVPVHIRAGTAGAPIKVGLNPARIAFTPDGKTAYVANYASQSITPIRLADGRPGPAIAAGKIPTRLAVSPDSTTVYVLDSNIFGEMGPEMPFRAQVTILFSAGQEAALLAGPGHSDPRRDQLCREAHKGRPAPYGHCDRPLNRAQRRHAPARLALCDVLSTIALELTGAAGSRCRRTLRRR